MPRFSIVMPCYNATATLAETLESLFAQTCQDWELICVDDGSTDGTQKLLTRYAEEDPRVRWIANCGKGPSSARNYGALTLATAGSVAARFPPRAYSTNWVYVLGFHFALVASAARIQRFTCFFLNFLDLNCHVEHSNSRLRPYRRHAR